MMELVENFMTRNEQLTESPMINNVVASVTPDSLMIENLPLAELTSLIEYDRAYLIFLKEIDMPSKERETQIVQDIEELFTIILYTNVMYESKLVTNKQKIQWIKDMVGIYKHRRGKL